MGMSLQGSNRIYCVVLPERNEMKRKRSEVEVSETNGEVTKTQTIK